MGANKTNKTLAHRHCRRDADWYYSMCERIWGLTKVEENLDVYFLFRKASILFWPISRTINKHFTSDNELLKKAYC